MTDALQPERLARAALSRLGEPGDLRMTGLVHDLGAMRVHEHLSGERDLRGVLTDIAARLASLDPVRDLESADRLGIRFVIPGDPEWPAQVDDLTHALPVQERGGMPLGLWVRGPLRIDQHRDAVAIVGSRSATTYGEGVASRLAADLAQHGVTIVSGAAFGIDKAAHRGALGGGGATVAVLACGVDRVYPLAHKALLDHLADHGAVVSELPPGSAPTRARFLARNRLIAALTRGTIVVEAAVRSGALNTANWADRLSRPLMAVPGPVTSAQSAGVHQLVRAGSAQLVTSGADAREILGVAGTHLLVEPRAVQRPRDKLRPRDARVLEAVPVSRPAEVESIARTAGLGLIEVQSALVRLAREEFVVRVPSGWQLGEAARV
ncbi:DNA-processing protein DprA [Nocardioides cavernaquae]|uniref:DNA-protecting protein DprA n=1 Tax=Nocardioides cavernaquae TaxID=2321396 RepID=A0A3A5H291_9ACTN|nr:DNA-processing protein DprA [Nocardioides cavernaquae]RJS44929.1 DNA-protecting protein DprA [Nocardioides cavernaquae]